MISVTERDRRIRPAGRRARDNNLTHVSLIRIHYAIAICARNPTSQINPSLALASVHRMRAQSLKYEFPARGYMDSQAVC